MELAQIKQAVHTLTAEGLASIASSSFGMEGFGGAIAYYDTLKDKLVTDVPGFLPAVRMLEGSPAVCALIGASEAKRIALQFVFNAYPHVRSGLSADAAFEAVWAGFVRELETPTWTYAAIANIRNLNFAEASVELADGVSIRARSIEDLESIGWGRSQLSMLADDCRTVLGSPFVLVLEKRVEKTPGNLLFVDDDTALARAMRTLLALRVAAPGDVRIGRLFLDRPAHFNVGIRGVQALGFSIWHPGPAYNLREDMLPGVRRWYNELVTLDKRADKQTQNLRLALRSFASIYDRHFHQAEDRIIDAITAVEPLWKLDGELAFRLAFRTGALLGATDDECVSIYETVSKYYKIRSKIVHGSALTDEQSRLVADDEPMRAVVRQALQAFVHLANHQSQWTLAKLYKRVDATLLHAEHRKELRVAMDIS